MPSEIEEALRELREIFPRKWLYIEPNSHATCRPRGKITIEHFPEIQVDDPSGEVLYHQSNHRPRTLAKAMAEVRAWHASQQQAAKESKDG